MLHFLPLQGIADIYVIAAIVVYSKARSQLRWYPFNDPLMEYWLLNFATVSTYLHVVLIAVNRAFSMLFPLSYQRVWTRRTIYMSVVGVWMVNLGLKGYELWLNTVEKDPVGAFKYWSTLFTTAQYATVVVAMSIYTMVFAVLVWKRVHNKGMCSRLMYHTPLQSFSQ